MQLHLIFCLLHFQGQLKTSWSCSLERKDFDKSPGWHMSSLTRALLSVAKLQSQNDGRAARGIASKSMWDTSDSEWCRAIWWDLMCWISLYRLNLTRSRAETISPCAPRVEEAKDGNRSQIVSSLTFQSQSAGVTIGCHSGNDRMELKTVHLSDMLCFDTTWSNMQPQTRRLSFWCLLQNELLKHADAWIYWNQNVRFRHPKISLCDNHHKLQQFSALPAEYIRVDAQSVCPESLTISHANFGPKLEDSETWQ